MPKVNIQKSECEVPGFRRAQWDQLQPNEVVYIDGIRDGKPHCYGPHVVVDSHTHILRNLVSGKTFTCAQEVAYKEGPVVLITIHEGKIASVYADVPLELLFYQQHIDHIEPFRGLTVTRPKIMDSLPTLDRRYVEPFHEQMFEVWTIEKPATVADGLDPPYKREPRVRVVDLDTGEI